MARLCAEGNELVLRLSRAERLGALHGDVRVTLRAVEDLSISRQPFGELHGIRAPGTGVPHRIAVGTWRYRVVVTGRLATGGHEGARVSRCDRHPVTTRHEARARGLPACEGHADGRRLAARAGRPWFSAGSVRSR